MTRLCPNLGHNYSLKHGLTFYELSALMSPMFADGIVYTVAPDVLFVPAVGYNSAVSPGHRFIVAHPSSFWVQRGYFYFRFVDGPSHHHFGILHKYARRIIRADP